MLKTITCLWCQKTLDSGGSAWEVASSNGRCPSCTRFYDPAMEAQVEVVAKDRTRTGHIWRVRLAAGFAGLLLVPPCIALFVLHLPHHLIAAAGGVCLSLLGFAFFYTSKSEARNQLMGQTDLVALAKKTSLRSGPIDGG